MSLTRSEWVTMWESVQAIRRATNALDNYHWHTQRRVEAYKEVMRETDKIKTQIQSVIGQME